jgi:hypothetical protein
MIALKDIPEGNPHAIAVRSGQILIMLDPCRAAIEGSRGSLPRLWTAEEATNIAINILAYLCPEAVSEQALERVMGIVPASRAADEERRMTESNQTLWLCNVCLDQARKDARKPDELCLGTLLERHCDRCDQLTPPNRVTAVRFPTEKKGAS